MRKLIHVFETLGLSLFGTTEICESTSSTVNFVPKYRPSFSNEKLLSKWMDYKHKTHTRFQRLHMNEVNIKYLTDLVYK